MRRIFVIRRSPWVTELHLRGVSGADALMLCDSRRAPHHTRRSVSEIPTLGFYSVRMNCFFRFWLDGYIKRSRRFDPETSNAVAYEGEGDGGIALCREYARLFWATRILE
jgi:hypothetical protein